MLASTDLPANPQAITAKEFANLLGISQRHLWTLLAKKRVPQPIRLGRAVRWNRNHVMSWLSAGAPIPSLE